MCVAAAAWDRWPGDLEGVRFLQESLNRATEPVARFINFLGDDWSQLVLVAAGASWLFLRRLRIAAVMLVALIGLEALFVADLKLLLQRPVPVLPDDLRVLGDPGRYSFPSGHVAFAASYFGALLYFARFHWQSTSGLKWLLATVLILLAGLMGPARVSWGVHWPSDVLGGYVSALLGLTVLSLIYPKLLKRAALGHLWPKRNVRP